MDFFIFEGNISVKAAVESAYRKVDSLYIDKKKHDKDTNYIIAIAHKKGIPVHKMDRETINAMAQGNTHGGVIAKVSNRNYQNIDDLKDDDFIALVEGIEDPFNYGHVLRSLYASGCQCLITTNRNFNNADNIICKASAGASEKIKIIKSDDLEKTISSLKPKFKIVCANRTDDAISMYDYNFNQPICICIGGEKRGLSRVVANLNDQNVFIPYNQDFKKALSAVNASTILAYEVLRQRYK